MTFFTATTTILLLVPFIMVQAFLPQQSTTTPFATTTLLATTNNSNNNKNQRLSTLPQGISPFEKSISKNIGISQDIRNRALVAIQQALQDGIQLQEIEFPPLLDDGKTQFDDFDNVQELNKNVDWCVELLPKLSSSTINNNDKTVWFLLPDLKECELAKEQWTGQRFRQAAKFTTIEAVANHYLQGSYSKPWGATFVDSISKLTGTGLLGDDMALDDLTSSPPPSIHLVCQPGNGGPVEDWVNVELLHQNAAASTTTTIIVNGALDKVRDGYYPAFFFPKLAATVDRFYKTFESVFFLKPISDKGLYGWIYRVYPEPWQVVLQTLQQKDSQRQYVENTVVYTSETRPSYAQAVQVMLQGQQNLSR